MGKRPGKRASDSDLKSQIWRLILASSRKQQKGVNLKILTKRLRVQPQQGESSQQRLARLIKEMEVAKRIRVVGFEVASEVITVLVAPSWSIAPMRKDDVVATAAKGSAEFSFDPEEFTYPDVYAQLLLHYLTLRGGSVEDRSGIMKAFRERFGLMNASTVQPAMSAALRKLRTAGLVESAPDRRQTITNLRLLKKVRPGKLSVEELLVLLPAGHRDLSKRRVEPAAAGDTHSILEEVAERRGAEQRSEEPSEPAKLSVAQRLRALVEERDNLRLERDSLQGELDFKDLAHQNEKAELEAKIKALQATVAELEELSRLVEDVLGGQSG